VFAITVTRKKAYSVAVRPDEDVLALETVYFADEIRSADGAPREGHSMRMCRTSRTA